MILTPHQTVGPLFGFAMTPAAVISSVPEDHPEAIVVSGRLTDGAGEGLGYGAFVELWSTEQAVRARVLDGSYRTVVRRPAPVPQPDGSVLAPHLDLRIVTRGLALPLLTKLYLPDEAEANAADPVLAQVPEALRDRLIAHHGESERHFVLDVCLQGESESVFFTIDPPRSDQP